MTILTDRFNLAELTMKLKPNEDRAKYATIAMYSMMVLSLAGLGFQLYTANLDAFYSQEDYDNFLFLTVAIAIVIVAISVLAAIFFIMWFRRAYYNLHQLSPRGLQYTEGWAAGAWFIPIFNLWGPHQIATDLFKKTEEILIAGDLTESQPVRHQLKNWWWGMWIASYIFGRIDAYGDEVNMVIAVLSTSLSMVAAFLAVRVIKSYHDMEVLLPKLGDVSVGNITNDDLLDSGF